MSVKCLKTPSLVVLAAFSQCLASWQAGATPADFSVVRAPMAEKLLCAPIFFCRTGSAESSSTPGGAVEWCATYASEILKRKTTASQLLLVRIDESVKPLRLKEIATELNQLARCSGTWPPNRPPLVISETSSQGTIGTRVVSSDSSNRGVVILEPQADMSAKDAALLGPDYSDCDFVTNISDIPCSCNCY